MITLNHKNMKLLNLSLLFFNINRSLLLQKVIYHFSMGETIVADDRTLIVLGFPRPYVSLSTNNINNAPTRIHGRL